MKTFFITSGAVFLCIIAFVFASTEVFPQQTTTAETLHKDDTDLDSSPSDVASVSKFIKEFHRQIDEEVYWTPERSDPVQESSYSGNIVEVSDNQTSAAESEDEVNSTSVVNCGTDRQAGSLNVELVNSTRLVTLLTTDPNITSRSQKAECVVLLFYARTCPFSCMAAPHFNALPRAFPAIKMAAVNALQYQRTSFSSLPLLPTSLHSPVACCHGNKTVNQGPGFSNLMHFIAEIWNPKCLKWTLMSIFFNTQYGIVGVPTVMLFHNGRPAAKFNDSEYTLEMFSRFITQHSGILPEEKMFVTSADFGGPVPSVVARETDYWLGLAWLVIALVGGVGIAKSRMWHNIVEAVQNSWREAEAQHFHAE